MNPERMAGMLESSAKGTWQIGEAFWKKESVGTSARCSSLAGRANGTSPGCGAGEAAALQFFLTPGVSRNWTLTFRPMPLWKRLAKQWIHKKGELGG